MKRFMIFSPRNKLWDQTKEDEMDRSIWHVWRRQLI